MAIVEIEGGRRVHYDSTGDGPVLLLIRGLGGHRGDYAPVVQMFSPYFRVVTFDNRDAGESGSEPTSYSIADMATDTLGLLRGLGVERAHVLGHSMGGFIALHLVLSHPELVDRLILVGTSPAAGAAVGRPLVAPTVEEWIEDPVERSRGRAPVTHGPGYFDTRPEELEEVAELSRGNQITREGYSRQLGAISDTHDVRDRLGEITVPTLVLHGDIDPLVPLLAGEVLAQSIPGARLVVYPGVGHYPHREAAADFRREVLAFLGAEALAAS